MNTKCPNCSRAPSGIDGHADLMVESVGSGVLKFKCRSCDTLWLRTRKRQAVFAWLNISEERGHAPQTGVLVPPTTGAHLVN